MPTAPRKLCRCGGVTKDGRCEKCGGKANQGHTLSRHERGYDSRWDKVSKRVKQELPWCIPCWAAERITVDHIETHHCVKIVDAPALRLERDNLLNCCPACHHALDALYEANRTEYDQRIRKLKIVRDELLRSRDE